MDGNKQLCMLGKVGLLPFGALQAYSSLKKVLEVPASNYFLSYLNDVLAYCIIWNTGPIYEFLFVEKFLCGSVT